MIVITKRHAVVERCSDVAGVAVPYIERWIPHAVMRSQVLIVDGRALTRREGLLLRAYSRLPERQPIILIDDGSVLRAELALIAVDYNFSGAVPNSRHTHGRAADMYSADHGGKNWNLTECNLLRDAALATSPAPVELLACDHYTDKLLHAGW